MASSTQRRRARRAVALSVPEGQPNTPEQAVEKTEEHKRSKTPKAKEDGRPSRMWKIVEAASVILGVASVLSFFPRLTVSEPIQMDATDLFSYKITVTNDGLLPVFWADWALAPRIVQVGVGSSGITPDKHVQLLLPHYARWTIKASLPSYGMKVFPGSGMTVPEAEDYEFQLKRPDTTVGILAPGDGFTFTTEGLIGAPSGATYDTVDFAVAVSYVPVFPPIPMQTCSHTLVSALGNPTTPCRLSGMKRQIAAHQAAFIISERDLDDCKRSPEPYCIHLP
jgi:hypothetical protein